MPKKKKGFGKFVMALMGLVIGIVGSFYGLIWITIPNTEDVSVSDETYYSKSENKVEPEYGGPHCGCAWRECG